MTEQPKTGILFDVRDEALPIAGDVAASEPAGDRLGQRYAPAFDAW